jgi:hypothetical protein
VITALIQRDPKEAQRLLTRLYETEPDHARIGELELLLDSQHRLDQPVTDSAGELHWLQNQLTPLTETLLGSASRDLLVPHWRRLTYALIDSPFDPARPQLHASYTAIAAMDWHTVRRVVEQESNWKNHPLLLQRHAGACTQLQAPGPALASWFSLCWRFPDTAADAIERQTDPTLANYWLRFLELEPELPIHSFPAWLLVVKPGFINVLPDDIAAQANPPESFTVLIRLLARITQPAGSEMNMALRTQLKKLDNALFAHYLHNHASIG